MPTIGGGGGGDGGAGGGGGGAPGAAGGGTATAAGRGTKQIIPSGQERPVGRGVVTSRSAPCPGCTPLADMDPCFTADCAGGNSGDPDAWVKYFKGGRGAGGGGGGWPGEPRGGFGGIFHFVPAPRPGNPPGGGVGPGGGGNPGGGQDPGNLAAPGRGIGQGGLPGGGRVGGPGLDLNSFLGGLLGLLGTLGLLPPGTSTAQPARVYSPLDLDHGSNLGTFGPFYYGSPAPVVPSSNPPPALPLPGPARQRYILKRVPGSFELPLLEDRERKRRRREYTAPPVARSNRRR